VSDSEHVFACVFMLAGVLIFALIIANMTSILAHYDVLRVMFTQDVSSVSRYLKEKQVPGALQQQLTSYFNYTFLKHQGMQEVRRAPSICNPLLTLTPHTLPTPA
jgi:hypothetical protein